MKTLPLDRRGCIIGIVNALLAVGLTVLSFWYIQPKNCYRFCGEPEEGKPCPTGACRWWEQQAGWPLPVFVDNPGGGSPTGGWGMLGPEDPPLLGPIILDVLFYSALLWLALYFIQLVRSQALPLRLIPTTLPLNVFLAASLWIFYLFFGYYAPIGRGHSEQVYVDTPTSTFATLGFSPIVSIPLEELIGIYGEPDSVWLTPDGATEALALRMTLQWDSIGMFVELPQIENPAYVVEKTTRVETIIFFEEEEPVLRIAGEPLGEKKIAWTGYGVYQP